jgi:hypothetical protein
MNKKEKAAAKIRNNDDEILGLDKKEQDKKRNRAKKIKTFPLLGKVAIVAVFVAMVAAAVWFFGFSGLLKGNIATPDEVATPDQITEREVDVQPGGTIKGYDTIDLFDYQNGYLKFNDLENEGNTVFYSVLQPQKNIVPTTATTTFKLNEENYDYTIAYFNTDNTVKIADATVKGPSANVPYNFTPFTFAGKNSVVVYIAGDGARKTYLWELANNTTKELLEGYDSKVLVGTSTDGDKILFQSKVKEETKWYFYSFATDMVSDISAITNLSDIYFCSFADNNTLNMVTREIESALGKITVKYSSIGLYIEQNLTKGVFSGLTMSNGGDGFVQIGNRYDALIKGTEISLYDKTSGAVKKLPKDYTLTFDYTGFSPSTISPDGTKIILNKPSSEEPVFAVYDVQANKVTEITRKDFRADLNTTAHWLNDNTFVVLCAKTPTEFYVYSF